jgi:hypothetical protein
MWPTLLSLHLDALFNDIETHRIPGYLVRMVFLPYLYVIWHNVSMNSIEPVRVPVNDGHLKPFYLQGILAVPVPSSPKIRHFTDCAIPAD